MLDTHQVRAVSVDGFPPLYLAAFFGHAEIVTLLLQMGADCNAVAQNGSAVEPLHSAVAGRDARIVERLLLAGAHVNARQNGGFTPLHAALQNEDHQIVALLRRRGA